MGLATRLAIRVVPGCHGLSLGQGEKPGWLYGRCLAQQGYEFEDSKALTEDRQHFVGLPLDDENQFELTDQLIADWCLQIIDESGTL